MSATDPTELIKLAHYRRRYGNFDAFHAELLEELERQYDRAEAITLASNAAADFRTLRDAALAVTTGDDHVDEYERGAILMSSADLLGDPPEAAPELIGLVVHPDGRVHVHQRHTGHDSRQLAARLRQAADQLDNEKER